MYYRINTPRIVHETIDAESIIIDFDSGTYYSARNAANLIWLLLAEGSSTVYVVQRVVADYAGAPEEIEAAVRGFIAQLAQESLIVEISNGQHQSTTQAASSTPSGQKPFIHPLLERYTDMQDLLLLDPIHEVDEQGWPMRKQ
jgi:hypothetical protein